MSIYFEPQEAEIEVRNIEAANTDEALEAVKEMLAPGMEVIGYQFKTDYRFGHTSPSYISVKAQIRPGVTVPKEPEPTVIESSSGPPMIVMPPVPRDPESVTVIFDLSFHITSVPDATTLGSYVDEIRGHMQARADHYKFRPGGAQMIAVRTEHTG